MKTVNFHERPLPLSSSFCRWGPVCVGKSKAATKLTLTFRWISTPENSGIKNKKRILPWRESSPCPDSEAPVAGPPAVPEMATWGRQDASPLLCVSLPGRVQVRVRVS